MLGRVAMVVAGLLAAGSAVAEPMNADTARRFVAGKLFAYNCFDGTRGSGRIYPDGSVAGTMQARNGPVRYMMLPPGTLHVKGQAVCASVRGMMFEPCFSLTKTDEQSFRGAVSGLGFAYCDFTRRNPRPSVVRTTWRLNPARPLPTHAEAKPAATQE
ncbi:MAG: hypothetical protein QOI12_3939 [Alphaproteobacteria bacterium]|nr:hypothetical protein [Alphaproteobacteria bacterium]